MIKRLYYFSVAFFIFLDFYMKLKNEHFWLLIFAVNFVSFQFVQDYIRPQYAGDSSLIRYFLGVVPNFFPSVGIPSLFMVPPTHSILGKQSRFYI